MPSSSLLPSTRDALIKYMPRRSFAKGETIRTQGAFARVMHFILSGEVEIDLDPASAQVKKKTIGQYSPVGEIGFIIGKAANANAIALTDIDALEIDYLSLANLAKETPQAAADFSRYLAKIIDSRLIENDDEPLEFSANEGAKIEVVLCKSPECVLAAQHLRYLVYCKELNRKSPYADNKKQILADDMDDHGALFVAYLDGQAVGTVRVNLARDGDLGVLENLYNMHSSRHHRQATSTITKFAILNEHRKGPTYGRLFEALITYLLDSSVEEGYIDGIPKIAKFYKLLGFKQCGDEFIHYENGHSIPMVVNLDDLLTEKSKKLRRKIAGL